ncbi:MAG: hypothetical protein EZS28_011980, partial [Streblomastix strix]
ICAIIEEGGSLRVLNGTVYSSKLSPRGDCKGGFIYIESKAPHGSASDFTLYNLNMSYCTANHGNYIFINSSGPFNSASLGEKMMNIKIGYPSSEYPYEQTFDVRGGTWNETGNFTTIPVNQSYYSFSSDTIYAGQNDDDAIGNKLDCGINDTYRCRSLDAAIYKIQSRSGTRTIKLSGQADYGRNRYVDQAGKTLSIEGTNNATVVVHYTRVDTTNKWAALYIIGGTLQINDVNFFVGGQRSGALFIVFGTTSQQANLKLTNSWITQNKTEDKYIIGDYYNGPLVQTFLTSVTLNGCWFENISTRSMLTNATMNTLGLWDNKYYDNQMGAALSVVNGPLSVNHTWFTNCSLIGTTGSNAALIGGSALYFDWSNVAANTLTVLDSRFYDCTVTFENNFVNTSQTIGAAVRATLGGSGIKATLNDTKFYDNKLALGIGAGIYLNLSNTSSVVFSNCSLQNNIATQGAGITISGNPSATFNQCIFCTNVVTSGVLLGYDIYFNTASYSSTQHILNECYSSSDQKGSSRRISFAYTSTLRIPDYDGQCPVKDYPTYDPSGPGPDPGDTEHDRNIYVDYTNGVDSVACSSQEKHCKTIGYALQLKLKENGTTYDIWIISPNTQQEVTFPISGKTVSLNKVNSTKPVINPQNASEDATTRTVLFVNTSLTLNYVILNHLISTSLTSLITVNGANATLTLNYAELKSNALTSVYYKPFIIGTRGNSIEISNSNIGPIALNSTASISTTENINILLITDSIFESVQNYYGTTGGSVAATILNNSVTFSGGSFTISKFNNYTATTYGGGIYIYLHNNINIGQLSFAKNIIFRDNNATRGRNIYVNATTRDKFYNEVLQDFEIDDTQDTIQPFNNSAIVYFRNDIPDVTEPIMKIQQYYGSSIGVNSLLGKDKRDCGNNNSNACFSINYARDQLIQDAQELTILIYGQAELNTQLISFKFVWQPQITVKSAQDQSPVNISVQIKSPQAGTPILISGLQAYLDSTNSLLLQDLNFYLASGMSHTSIAKLSYSYGQLTVIRCTIQWQSEISAVSNNPLLFVYTGNLLINTTGTGGNIFRNIQSQGINGTIVNAQLNSPMSANINNAIFENNIVDTTRYGGAVYIWLKDINASVMFSNATFRNNAKRDTKPDHVFIECANLYASIGEPNIKGIVTLNSSDVLGYWGNDELNNELVNLATLLFGYSTRIVYADGEKGNDRQNCGPKAIPCRTLNYSIYEKTKEDKQEVIIINTLLVPNRTNIDGQDTTLRSISRTQQAIIYANHYSDTQQDDTLIYSTTNLKMERINVKIGNGSPSTIIESSIILHQVTSAAYQLVLTECTFEGDNSIGYTRKPLIQEIRGTIRITNCTFRNIYVRSNDGMGQNGGAVDIQLNVSTSAPISSIEKSVFDNCQTYHSYGGALSIDLGTNSIIAGQGIIIDDCRFISNQATTSGGAIFFNHYVKEYTISNCYFNDNQIGVGYAGNDIDFQNITLAWIDEKHIINSFSNTVAQKFKIGGTNDPLVDRLLPPYTKDYTLGPSNYQNMGAILAIVKDNNPVYINVLVEQYDSTFTLQNGVSIGSRRFNLVGSSINAVVHANQTQNFILQISDKGFLRLEDLSVRVDQKQKAFEASGPSAQIELDHVTLSPPDTTTIIEEPYIQLLNGANLLIYASEITTSVTSNRAAIEILNTASKVRIINSIFQGITRNQGNGSVIEASFVTNTFLSIEGTTNFTYCRSSGTDARGGAVYLSVNSGSDDFIFEKNVQFVGNAAGSGTSQIANSLFIKADTLIGRIDLDKIQFGLGLSDYQYLGKDTILDEIPLYYLFTSFNSSTIYISELKGVDEVWCGRVKYPCKTIIYGREKLTGTQISMRLVDAATLTQTAFLDGNLTILSENIRSPVKISVSGSGGFIVSGYSSITPKINISNLDFNITNQLNEGVHLLDSSSQSSTINVSDCVFQNQRPQQPCLVSAGVIRVANADSVTIERCEFLQIIALDGSGVSIALINNKAAVVKDCLFNGGLTQNGHGAGISVILSNQSQSVTVSRSRFIDNTVRNSRNVGGGAIYFNITGQGNQIKFDTCYFGGNQHLQQSGSSNRGSDIFFELLNSSYTVAQLQGFFSNDFATKCFSNSQEPRTMYSTSEVPQSVTILEGISLEVYISSSSPSTPGVNGSFPTLGSAVTNSPNIFELIERRVYITLADVPESTDFVIGNKLFYFLGQQGTPTGINVNIGVETKISITDGSARFETLSLVASANRRNSNLFELVGDGFLSFVNCILRQNSLAPVIQKNIIIVTDNTTLSKRKDARLNIQNSQFNNFRLTNVPLIQTIDVLDVNIESCTFDNDQRTDSSDILGTQSTVISSKLGKEQSRYTIRSSTFNNILTGTGASDNAFKGVGIYIDNTADSTNLLLYNLTFTWDNSATNKVFDKYARFINLWCNNLFSFPIQGSVQQMGNQLSDYKEQFNGRDLDSSTNIPLFYLTQTYQSQIVYVKGTGTDMSFCGGVDYPCKTIRYAYNHTISGSGSGNSRQIIVSAATVESVSLTVQSATQINGDNTFNHHVISFSKSGTSQLPFLRSTSDLSLSYLNILTNNDFDFRNVFEHSYGTLTLSNVEIGGVQYTISNMAYPAIYITGGSASLNNVRLQFITSITQGSKGAGLYANIIGSATVNIQNSNFISIINTLPGSLGAAIYLRTVQSTNLANNFRLTNIYYEGCKSQSDGFNVFLESGNLVAEQLKSKFSVINIPGTDDVAYIGVDNYPDPIELGKFIQPRSDFYTVYVSESKGFDDVNCYFDRYPCKTLNYGFDVQKNNTVNLKKTIIVDTLAYIKAVAEYIISTSIPPDESEFIFKGQKAIPDAYGPYATVIVDTPVDQQATTHTLINIYNASLTIENISFEVTHNVPGGSIISHYGKNGTAQVLVIKNTAFTGFIDTRGQMTKIDQPVIFSYGDSDIYLYKVNISNFEVENGGRPQYGDKMGGGLSAFMTDPDTKLNITSCIFSSILLNDGYGGAVGIQVQYNSSEHPEVIDLIDVNITGTIFAWNKAINGLGGAIAVFGIGRNISIRSCSFQRNEGFWNDSGTVKRANDIYFDDTGFAGNLNNTLVGSQSNSDKPKVVVKDDFDIDWGEGSLPEDKQELWVGENTSISPDGSEPNPYPSIADAVSHTALSSLNPLYIQINNNKVYEESNLNTNERRVTFQLKGTATYSSNAVNYPEINARTSPGVTLFRVNGTGDLKLKYLTIKGYQNSTANYLINVQSGSLLIDNVDFIATVNVYTQSFIYGLGGQFTFIYANFKDIQVDGCPIVYFGRNVTAVNISQSNFENIEGIDHLETGIALEFDNVQALGISITNTQFSGRDSIYSSQTHSTNSHYSSFTNVEGDVCSWDRSAVLIKGSNQVTMSGIIIENFKGGGLSIQGPRVTIG